MVAVPDDDKPVRMTVAELALMREIAKWRREQEITYWRARGIGRFVVWAKHGAPGARREVTWDPSNEPRELGHGNGWRRSEYVKVANVTQAVDVLVALGYLPARFSSAYRAGWESREYADRSAAAGGFGQWDTDIRPAAMA